MNFPAPFKNETMKIEFVKGHNAGKVEERPDRAAKTLIRLGLAKELKKEKTETKELKEVGKTKAKK